MMPTKVMDQRQLSPYHMPSVPSSFFSEEHRFPSEVGFWKAESGIDNRGIERMPLVSGSKPVSSSPREKLAQLGGNNVECLELPQAYVFKDQKAKIGLEHHLRGTTSTTSLSRNLWRSPNNDHVPQSSSYAQPASQLVERNKVNFNGRYYENGLFSSSLSETFNRKISLSTNDVPFGRSVDAPEVGDNEPFESSEETEAQTIGNLLPDDEDLLSGIIDNHDYIACRNNGVDFEDDLFCSGGGMEIEAGNGLNFNRASDFVGRKSSYGQLQGPIAPFAGEHPYGEHSSRTPFLRSTNNNFEDAELRDLFEDVPSEKDINEGTLVVFNLNSSVSNEELHQIFGVYGEVKEIRENPLKHHYRFVEFYDVRAAEAAFRALNKRDIAGNRIKLVPSRPGGARHGLMQQLRLEQNQEDASGYQPLGTSSSPGMNYGVKASPILDNFQGLHSSVRPLASSFMDTAFHGTTSGLNYSYSPMRASMVNNQSNQSGTGDHSHSIRQLNSGYQCMPAYHPHSLPEYHGGIVNGIPFSSPRTVPAMDNMNSRPAGGFNSSHICKVCTGSLNSHSFEHNEAALGILGDGSGPPRGDQYRMNTSDTHHRPPGAMMWQNSPTFVNSIPSHPPMQGYPRAPSNLPNSLISLYNHHVGSAPTMNPSIWDRQHAYTGDSMESTAFHPASLGNNGLSGSSPVHTLLPHTGGNGIDHSTSSAHVASPQQQRRHGFHGRTMSSWNRRSDSSTNQSDNKKQYELDIDRILRAEDSRTTLMLKNIPNKYTSKMLLTTIDENHRGTYDFIYLPIDFKNKCNMGYAFINMIEPQQIIPFYKAFNGKKWEKFNSEKVASIAYARIQGRQALIAHFQNSSLMNEDKRCRPILFQTDGPNAGDQEPFPMGTNIRSRPGRSRTATTAEESHNGNPLTSAIGEEAFNAAGSSCLSTKESM